MSQDEPANNVRPGHYRVIGTDTFPWPNEDYHVGDYRTLSAAKRAGQKERQEMTVIRIYDSSGTLVASASGPGNEWDDQDK